MENLSLFHMAEESQEQMELPSSGKLDVVKMEFSGAQTLSWPSLFSGFDTLHAITYSSGIGFVYELLALFEQAEVIFGCDEVISYSLQEVMAYQCKMVERMRETAGKMKVNLVSRIDNGTLRFFVAHTVLSHEKIYLLSAKDGRKRVIMGSANMSFAAFNGHQRENICYIDGEEAYQWYFHCYNQLRDESTDQIAKESLLCADDGENLEELPIARTTNKKGVSVTAGRNCKRRSSFCVGRKKSGRQTSTIGTKTRQKRETYAVARKDQNDPAPGCIQQNQRKRAAKRVSPIGSFPR